MYSRTFSSFFLVLALFGASCIRTALAGPLKANIAAREGYQGVKMKRCGHYCMYLNTTDPDIPTTPSDDLDPDARTTLIIIPAETATAATTSPTAGLIDASFSQSDSVAGEPVDSATNSKPDFASVAIPEPTPVVAPPILVAPHSAASSQTNAGVQTYISVYLSALITSLTVSLFIL